VANYLTVYRLMMLSSALQPRTIAMFLNDPEYGTEAAKAVLEMTEDKA
jgi:hypothetical protein